MDDGRKVITIAHPEQSSGELKRTSLGKRYKQGALRKGKQDIVGNNKRQNVWILGQHGGKLGHRGTLPHGSTLRQLL